MNKILLTISGIALLASSCSQNTSKTALSDEGEELYSKVKQFVAIGEHRTGTAGDSATSAWLKKELDSIGAKTEFTEFSLKQFFFESGQLTVDNKKADVFPVWPVKEGLSLSQTKEVVDGDHLTSPADAKGKLILTRLQKAHGATNPEIAKQINAFIDAGAAGVLAVTLNNTGEIQALNTFKGLKPWNAPVYHLAPKDTSIVLDAIAKKTALAVDVKGSVKDVTARNIVGKIGSGKKYVVISTPISGWFTTGGERGPGIAEWLGLAKWAAQNTSKYPDYTFVFTGNSGHELSILGAEVFVDKTAPKPEETELWIHLGAGVAVKSWNQENNNWTLADTVDSKRYIYYSSSVAEAFEKAFADVKAKKVKGTEENKTTVKAGGEGGLYQEKGYKNLVSLAYSHRLHHVRSDDAKATSPELLEDLYKALVSFVETKISK